MSIPRIIPRTFRLGIAVPFARAGGIHDIVRVILVACLVGGAACGRTSAGDEDDEGAHNTPPVHPVVAVGTTVAAAQRFTPTVRATGAVTPTPGGYAELSAPGPVRVAHVYVGVGEPVRAGAPLVAFESAPLQAAARSTAAALAAARTSYDRAVRLSALGILPHKAVDQSAADLAQARAADVIARRAYQLATLRSPISGVVTRVSAVQGSAVDANTVLVAVTDPARLGVTLLVSPDAAAQIQRSAAVTLRAGEPSGTPPVATGIVTGVGVALDSATHAVPIRVTLHTMQRPLRVGETVTGEIVTSSVAQAVVVPTVAIVPNGDSTTVFVVDHGIAHARAVTVGARTDSTVRIVRGVAPGETVVTTGAFGVQDGSSVTTTTRPATVRP